MTISGDDAKRFNAVRLSDYGCVNDGELIEADEQTGLVRWRDRTGTEKSATLGEHAIRLALRSTLGR